MKKIALILLISMYAFSTAGISVNEFYCCGKLKSVKINIARDANAKCDKGDEKTGCCKTEHQFFKVKDNHLASTDIITPDKYFVDVDSRLSFLEVTTFANHSAAITNCIHAPPLYCNNPIYILNCVYRI